MAAYFDSNTNPSGPSFQAASLWEPESFHLPPPLWDLIAKDQEALRSISPALPPDKDNLDPSEWSALQSLIKDTSIIIKPADKGSNVVIMDRPLYIQEAMRQLNDLKYYSPLPGPMYQESAGLFKDLLKEMKTKKILSNILSFSPKSTNW